MAVLAYHKGQADYASESGQLGNRATIFKPQTIAAYLGY
jgi:hypothetical protein